MTAGYKGRWAELEAGFLNPDLDVERYAAEFRTEGMVQLDHALRPGVAEFLHEVLDRQVPWHLAYRDRGGSRKLSPAELSAMDEADRSRLDEEILELARTEFQFSYLSYMMVTAYMNQHDPDLPLHRVLELLNHRDWLGTMRRITGLSEIARTNAQATCYRAGNFLTKHNDSSDEEHRLVAYVINLTRDWHADWGGLLQFLDEDERVIRTFSPRFNTISMFKTPRLHCVSPVAPFATGSRYAITGWMLTRA